MNGLLSGLYCVLCHGETAGGWVVIINAQPAQTDKGFSVCLPVCLSGRPAIHQAFAGATSLPVGFVIVLSNQISGFLEAILYVFLSVCPSFFALSNLITSAYTPVV